MKAYYYIYENHKIYPMPWDSLWTWIAAAVAYDLGYYVVHRAAHEVNLLWAAHQVHHSSEEYNLTTALRQSTMQAFGSWFFYLPMAFFIPPTHAIVHAQFNLLYQFWIHTELIDNLGPLEHVLNTPQHHRVHHGSNRYCLDKNYAAVLIIWDRMFGTFVWERKSEKIVYGLVDQPQFFNPLKHQAFYYGKIAEKVGMMDNWRDKMSAVFKGPGWFPGTPRLGNIEEVPEIQKRKIYNPKVHNWVHFYSLIHFILVFLAFEDLSRFNVEMSQMSVLAIIGFLLWTLTSIGLIYDKSGSAWFNELFRSATFLILYHWLGAWNEFRIPVQILNSAFAVSALIAAVSIIAPKVMTSGAKKVD